MITVDEMRYELESDYELLFDLNCNDWEIENRIAGWVRNTDNDYEIFL